MRRRPHRSARTVATRASSRVTTRSSVLGSAFDITYAARVQRLRLEGPTRTQGACEPSQLVHPRRSERGRLRAVPGEQAGLSETEGCTECRGCASELVVRILDLVACGHTQLLELAQTRGEQRLARFGRLDCAGRVWPQ